MPETVPGLQILFPGRSRHKPAHHTLDRKHFGLVDQHRAPAQLGRVLLDRLGILVDIRRNQMIRHDILKEVKPEERELGQNPALQRDSGRKDVVEGREAVGRYEQEMIVVGDIHISNFATGIKFQVAEVGTQ